MRKRERTCGTEYCHEKNKNYNVKFGYTMIY